MFPPLVRPALVPSGEQKGGVGYTASRPSPCTGLMGTWLNVCVCFADVLFTYFVFICLY